MTGREWMNDVLFGFGDTNPTGRWFSELTLASLDRLFHLGPEALDLKHLTGRRILTHGGPVQLRAACKVTSKAGVTLSSASAARYAKLAETSIVSLPGKLLKVLRAWPR